MEMGPIQHSALNWLIGYVEGTGREVPGFVKAAFAPKLIQPAPRNTDEPKPD
jgi:hypothetical protein